MKIVKDQNLNYWLDIDGTHRQLTYREKAIYKLGKGKGFWNGFWWTLLIGVIELIIALS